MPALSMPVAIRRALLSVSDKTNLLPFAKSLHALGVEILSTGGTASALQQAGIPVQLVSDYTGQAEIMDGRVKTLHPRIFGGLLARLPEDEAVTAAENIPLIDLLVVNLYPFRETIADPSAQLADAIENIDIGGPALIRATAKNFKRTLVITDPADYAEIEQSLRENNGQTDYPTRMRLAQKAFQHTAEYDASIQAYLTKTLEAENTQRPATTLPEHLSINAVQTLSLRYGENPQQTAAFYASSQHGDDWLTRSLQGKACSYNNLVDADTAFSCVRAFIEPACVIIKHANPCGIAIGKDALEAYERAYQTDASSAFGGIIAINRPLTEKLASLILERQFVEVLIAPSIEPQAQRILSQKPQIRVMAYGEALPNAPWEIRGVQGGFLLQTPDRPARLSPEQTTVVTKRQPSPEEWQALLFAWQAVLWVKSNAIVLANHQQTLGIGAGQPSRIMSMHIAAMKAKAANFATAGAAMASDAFFPFEDNVETAAEQGIRAIIQPGGSRRDEQVTALADKYNMAMVFTRIRHFRH
jgi:phosphoribosylaminoimidazolecarboxamide formyltransferase/IMP cyclohydrolase